MPLPRCPACSRPIRDGRTFTVKAPDGTVYHDVCTRCQRNNARVHARIGQAGYWPSDAGGGG